MKKKFLLSLMMLGFLGLTSCGQVITGPEGPVGPQGNQGEIGPQGEPGEDGHTPYIGSNGDWWINYQDTGIKAEGIDGKDGYTPEIRINEDGFWVIDGNITSYRAEGSNEEIIKALEYSFDYENIFVKKATTHNNPIWSYTTSTFSGWGGSIGKPSEISVLRFKVRARHLPVQKVRVFISENDKNGEVIASEDLDVSIAPMEESYITWSLPEKIINNTKNLYFTFNCDSFIDVWSEFSRNSLIPEEEYQAISTYSVSGNILESPSKMTDVYNAPCHYLYVEFGVNEQVFKLKNSLISSENINVNLANEYALAVNDNFQLFYRGVIQAVNPYNYGIDVLCQKGNVYPRYYEWTPTSNDVGSYNLTLNVYDNSGKIIGTDKTVLNVYDPAKSHETANVLCFGDSLTSSGTWVKEAARRYTQTGGSIQGLGLDYLNFIGNKKVSLGDKQVGYEGTGGWTWGSYLSDKSPFYNPESKSIDFKWYAKQLGVSKIDYVYVLLTWNGMNKAFADFTFNDEHFKNMKTIVEQLNKDFPECQIRTMGLQMPSQNGGMGANYGATGGYSNSFGMLVSAMNYNKTLEKFCMQSNYNSYMKYIDVAGQFDTDYNMPSTQKPANNRTDVTETIGTNGVHPSTNGYYQIADAAFRSLCRDFAKI